MKSKHNTPQFNSEDDEREYWSSFDLTTKFLPADFGSAVFPNLKPTSRSVAIRIPEYLLARLKEKAHELNIPYQTLMKQFIAKGLLG